jgi:hypothetical protein
VAFHHNIPLWVVASLLYNDCFLYVPFDFNILKEFRGTAEQKKHHLHESPL